MKRTKIIATLGPSTDEPDVLRHILVAGVDLVRLNLSHGDHETHKKRIELTRNYAQKMGRPIGIIIDLQGPKIRIGCFKGGFVDLKVGDRLTLDPDLQGEGDQHRVSIDYKNIAQEVHPGDILLLDDGLIVLLVNQIQGNQVHCIVKCGGKLSDRKGINRRGGGLTVEFMTDKDRKDIAFAASQNTDYVAVSFPRDASDIEKARALLRQAGSQAGILAKIERVEAVEAIDEIIKASDGVMVARGDLGVELGIAELPAVQKHIIGRARALDKAVITATQMMESMITHSVPTRAEVSDVANAILDGTDAVMLSAESASGKYPQKTVEMMHEICLVTERQKITQVSHHRLECRFHEEDEAIAMAAVYTANHIDTKAIISLTDHGTTPLWMSRIRTGIPIFAISRHSEVCGRMTLFRGVYPIPLDLPESSSENLITTIIDKLKSLKLLAKGDRIVITRGNGLVGSRGTNTMSICTVE